MKKVSTILLLIFIAAALGNNSYAKVLESDSLALVDLYNSTNGSNWTNNDKWLSSSPVNEWHGITVTNERVVSVSLTNNGLSGQLPSSIGLLTGVTYFSLGNNDISGEIPSEIGNMTSLQRLYLNDNLLSGTIPSSLGNFPNIHFIHLYNNSLNGEIPSALGNLSTLTQLKLQNNNLEGEIPASLGKLSVLYLCYLNDNNLSGAVPDSLKYLTALSSLYLYNNRLVDLPDLSSLAPQLDRLWVGGNRLTFEDLEPNVNINSFLYGNQDSVGEAVDTTIAEGSVYRVSISIGGTANEYYWYKDGRLLSSTPDSVYSFTASAEDSGTYVCRIINAIAANTIIYSKEQRIHVVETNPDSTALVALYNATDGANWTHNDNWLNPDSAISSWYGVTVTDGRVTEIRLSNNNMNGDLPEDIGNLTELTLLKLDSNNLSGSLPDSMANLKNLENIYLYSNSISGSLPDWLGGLSKLTDLSLAHNNFSGEIPASLGALSVLSSLNLSYNNLSGTIPASISDLTSLVYLYLSFNELSGSLPDTWEKMTSLAHFYVDGNNLSGELPPSLGALAAVVSVHINNNNFSGAIPDTLRNLTKVVTFDANGNNFDGMPDLISLTKLQYLFVKYNKLTFEDIEPNISGSFNFQYAPQDSVGETKDTTIASGSSFTMSVSVGGTANQYQWMKNGGDISGANSSVYTISSAALSDSGSYECKITNTTATELTLYSRPLNLHVIYVKPDMSVQDSLALVALYDSTDGDNWTNNTNWKSGSVKDWHGVSVDSGRVTALDLSDNNLKGVLPNMLGNLTKLKSLKFASDSISGVLPASIGNLTELSWLSIHDTQIQGEIPAEIGNMRNLVYLDLTLNNLQGSIPEEIGNLNKLIWFFLYYNHLEGGLPEGIGNLTSLKYFNIHENNISGNLPDLSKLSALEYFDISINNFEGDIPEYFKSYNNLQKFYIYENKFENLPDMSAITGINSFSIRNNRFTFEDIEPNVGISGIVYSPQDSVGEAIDTTIVPGDSYTLSVHVGGSANLYQWRKNGVNIEGATDSVYTISSAVLSDSGYYICKINNSTATELTLYSRPQTIHIDIAQAIGDNYEQTLPEEYTLKQNYPNPFNPSTKIEFSLPKESKVTVYVYNLLGQRVATLMDAHKAAGRYSVTFNADNLSAGLYLYEISAGDFHQIKKMLLVK